MNIKVVLLGLAALAGTSYFLYNMNGKSFDLITEAEIMTEFIAFKGKFDKQYASLSELAYRQKIFANTLKRVRAHNADFTQTYKLGINKFSDMTAEERKAKYLVDFPKVGGSAKCEKSGFSAFSADDDKVVDWLAAKKVQAVKDQQDCGSCWAFATTGALESAYAIFKNVDVPDISEQELVDCSGKYGNEGCNGGLMSFAYDYILENKINKEDAYPYTATDDDCNADLSGHGEYTIKGCVQVKSDVKDLIQSIRKQPVAVAFYVQDDFFDYSSGIYNPKSCSGHPNHGVLAVGFDLKNKTPFFHVKNSWGTGWGDKGFFKIAIGKGHGTCNISGTEWNYYPTL
jgi:cathepsin H